MDQAVDISEAPQVPVDAQCPACGLHPLVPVTLALLANGRWRQVEAPDPTASQHVVLDTCPVCFGAWFDRGEFDLLGDGAVDSVRLAGLDAPRSSRVCPRGHGPMYEHRLPGQLKTPIESCSRCAGIWLDGEERRKLAAHDIDRPVGQLHHMESVKGDGRRRQVLGGPGRADLPGNRF